MAYEKPRAKKIKPHTSPTKDKPTLSPSRKH